MNNKPQMAAVEILQVAHMTPKTDGDLDALFTVHKLWQADDKERLIAEHAAKIRGVATTGFDGFTAEAMDALPHLEVIACFAVGVDSVNVPHARSKNIPVTNSPDVLTDCVADLGLALTLAAARDVVGAERYVRNGQWPAGGMYPLQTSLNGKVLGIVGLGRIGKAVAKRAEAFGMRIAYQGRRRQEGVDYPYYETAEALAAASDFLILTCPGGPGTQNLVNRKVMQALGAKGYLINVARGSVVDEPALITALQAGEIAGAALDVFADEPNVPEVLLKMPNVILQPHHASATVETRDAMGGMVVKNLHAHFTGAPLLTPV